MEIVELVSILFVELVGSGVGACLGAYLGYRYGLKQGRSMRQEEDIETKKMLIDSLLVEIDYNITMMNKGFEEDNYVRKAFRYILFSNSVDSSIASGYFLLLSTTSQNMIREYLGGINHMNSLVRRLDTDVTNVISRVYNEQTPLLPTLKSATKKLKEQLIKERASTENPSEQLEAAQPET